MPLEKTYRQGAKVWIPHVEKGWETAVIAEDFAVGQDLLVVVHLADGTSARRSLQVDDVSLLPPLCLAKDSRLDLRDNLTSLAVVHEATVAHALRLRFELHRCPYSHCGIATLALNTYARQPVDGSYVEEILEFKGRAADPREHHVFAVAEKAFRNLQRENRDQSIIFSGKTGSGKTENAKLTILYLAAADPKDTALTEKILAALTVAEAFGNARTSKNDDSSRFGKFFELQYDTKYNVVGANLKTYLLHRSRVVSQPTQEQRFHIFYQLSSVQERFPLLQLQERDDLYHNCPETHGMNNSESFDKTVDALNILGFTSKEQNEIWLILSAILYLENISFKKLGVQEASDSVESCLISNWHGLKSLVKLFSLDQKAAQPLRKYLCHKRILSQQDEILQPMSVNMATRNRDGFAGFIYKELFALIVARVSASIRSPVEARNFIGALDLYGFEDLGMNSFEQFCVNYANEKIQQYYLQIVFKTEQEEYLRESIGWRFNQFNDNIGCLKLIERIVDIVDEESKLGQSPRDSQLLWLLQLHTECVQSKHFSLWKDGYADFFIHHFVAPVKYDPRTFVEKNRDATMEELVEVLKESKNELLRKIMTDEYSRFVAAKEKKKNAFNRGVYSKPSILSGFRISIAKLTDMLNKTNPNFVLCIIPNEERKAWYFDTIRVLEQLHAFNITEIVKMSAAGFFKKQSYANFFNRYHCLLPFDKSERTVARLQDNCSKIVEINLNIKDLSHVKFGKTKIFLREHDVVHLEELRKRKQHRASVVIQKAFKGYLEQKHYWQLRRATLWVQNHARKCMKRRRERAIRENRAAMKIQALVRGYLTRRWYRRFVRGYEAFRMYATLRVAAIVKRDLQTQMLNAFATLIQSVYRGYVARRRYRKMRRSAVVIQAWYRGRLGRRLSKQLKEDQMKQKNLENKLDDLNVKINHLIERHLSQEELVEMHQINDETQCMQAKNKALSRVLFEKIKALKGLRGKPPTDLKETQTEEILKVIPEESSGEETVQNTPRKMSEASTNLPEVNLDKEDSSEESVQSGASATPEIPAAIQGVLKIRPDKRVEQTCTVVKIIEGPEESEKESALELVKFDAIEAQEASALACQQTPPKMSLKKRRKICCLPELRLDVEEDCEEVFHYVTISAIDIFKSTMLEDNNDYCYTKVIEAYNKFDKRSEYLRDALKLGDYEIMKQKMLNRNSEISLNKLKSSPVKAKSFTDTALDISTRREQQPEEDVEENLEAGEKQNILGMFQFNIKHLSPLVYHLVIDLEVETILQSSPTMPVTIMFMCLRYLDSVNNNHGLVLMLHVYRRAVEGLLTNFRGFDVTTLWLANTHQLLNYLKQYSKSETFGWVQHHLCNTERQSRHRLCNLDVHLLYSYVHLIAVWIFDRTMELAHMRVSDFVIPAILDNEEVIVSDVTFDQRISDEARRLYFANHLYRLLKDLTFMYDICVKCGVSQSVIVQIFQKIFENINAIALNNFLFRNELCTNMKGSLIRCNIRTLEQWATNRKLSKAIESLGPVIEAMTLLHLLPFTSAAVDNILSYFKKLNYHQILKIISSYNPPYQLFTFDQELIVQKLQSKIVAAESLDNTVALNNSDSNTNLVLPFEYSPIHFDEIQIPKEFDADVLELI